MKTVAIIVAAGRGERFGLEKGPKQYRLLRGTSILQRCVSALLDHPGIDAVRVIIHSDDREIYDASVSPHPKLLEPAVGGETRQQSVRLGLESFSGLAPSNVLVHDAARPFVDQQTITDVLAAIAPGQGAIAASPVVDTLKRAAPNGTIAQTIDRSALHAAQTPQAFVFGEILAAHRQFADAPAMTDDASVAEAFGMTVRLVHAPSSNFKITTAQDLERANAMLPTLPDIRSATGYDVHQLEPGGPIWLCGVAIDHDRKLKGHSDADVGLHALTDALLGTIGAGDIGSHFPPSDPQWKGASSDRFLAHAVNLVREQGGTITNLDVTLICESPRIGPHRQAMRERIAEVAGVKAARVSIKATTNEGIGFIGRGEGIAAIATATVGFLPSTEE
ncbi:MAG: bifunctional 2-C-methyl-D-erythritol 4-phosphate cytidylyltransferase/2-C-methyl-D-erythritol 2,4-cyclodiphosphate synthase [Rhizobiaceae bacterium]